MQEKLKSFFGRSNIDKKFITILAALLERYASHFHLDTPERLILFLGQVKAEIHIRSNGTVRMRESLDYSVSALFSFSYFRKNPKLANKLGRKKGQKAQQRAIANIAYADENRSPRHRLGNIRKGDGWLFRGVGILQSTGRENVMLDLNLVQFRTGICIAYNAELSTDAEPIDELLSSYTVGVLMGMAHWERKRMYNLKSSMSVTNAVNIGLGSRAKLQRDEYTREARVLLYFDKNIQH